MAISYLEDTHGFLLTVGIVRAGIDGRRLHAHD
jgi:hypothetical protein